MNNVKNASRLEVVKGVADSDRKQAQGDAFGKFAAAASNWLGSKWAFVGAIVIIAVWAVTGLLFHYSDTWQSSQYGYDDHYVSDGLHYPEHAES